MWTAARSPRSTPRMTLVRALSSGTVCDSRRRRAPRCATSARGAATCRWPAPPTAGRRTPSGRRRPCRGRRRACSRSCPARSDRRRSSPPRASSGRECRRSHLRRGRWSARTRWFHSRPGTSPPCRRWRFSASCCRCRFRLSCCRSSPSPSLRLWNRRGISWLAPPPVIGHGGTIAAACFTGISGNPRSCFFCFERSGGEFQTSGGQGGRNRIPPGTGSMSRNP